MKRNMGTVDRLRPGYVPFGRSTRGGISTHGRTRFGGRARVVAQQ